jgi:hypothetical protein
MTTSVSQFERNKPKGTHRKINSAINKYEAIVSRSEPMDENEEAARVEMANDFIKELKSIRKSFLAGE